MVYSNQEAIFWPRVPYAKKIRYYFKRIDQDKRIFVRLIMNELYEMLGKRFLYIFQWLNKAKAQKKGIGQHKDDGQSAYFIAKALNAKLRG